MTGLAGDEGEDSTRGRLKLREGGRVERGGRGWGGRVGFEARGVGGGRSEFLVGRAPLFAPGKTGGFVFPRQDQGAGPRRSPGPPAQARGGALAHPPRRAGSGR